MTHCNFSMCRLLSVSMSQYRRTDEKNHCRRLSWVSTIIATSSTTLSKTETEIPSSPIRSGRGACCERKSRHDMAGFATGMVTTSGWALVRCDCRNRIHQVRQRRVARARRRWRPQPVHGGCDVQDRAKASIAHDAGDGKPFFSVRGCSCAQNRRAPKGGMGASTTTKPHEELQDPMGYNQQS